MRAILADPKNTPSGKADRPKNQGNAGVIAYSSLHRTDCPG